jgi:hypothetical protein
VEILAAIEAIDDVVHAARGVPFSSTLRVQAEPFRAGVARLRAAIRTDLPDVVAPRVAQPLADLERLCTSARERHGRLWLKPEAVYDLLDTARAVVVEDIRRQRGG